MATTTLYDAYGQKVDLGQLQGEPAAAASLTSVRSILSDHPSRGLTPQRLALILVEAEEGDATRYLELAEDMEEKDLHYLAQLGTRKRAVAQLEITVAAASDSADDVRAADLIRDHLNTDELEEVLIDVLDAVGKGFSVCEIMWDTSSPLEWRIADLVWREPKWFGFDPIDGTTLMLRESVGLVPLPPYKFVVHTHRAKSGLPIRGGLARAAAWSYLFKNYALKDWAAFAEIYGQPYRVGKYPGSATNTEKDTLLRAVSSIGSDAAAIIPEGMTIEFLETAARNGTDIYKLLCQFLDGQVSKAVLGQTLTADVSSDGGSRALGEVQNEVRRDIMRSDAKQLAATINRCIVRPLVDLNLGPRQRYPRVRIGLPDQLTTTQKVEALTKLVPLGLRIEESQVRDQLGYTEPADGARVLQAPANSSPSAGGPAAAPPSPPAAAHSAAARGARDAIEVAVDASLDDDGWRPLMDPLVDPVQRLLDDCGTVEEFRERLSEVVVRMDVTKLRESLSRGAFASHMAGALEIELADQDG